MYDHSKEVNDGTKDDKAAKKEQKKPSPQKPPTPKTKCTGILEVVEMLNAIVSPQRKPVKPTADMGRALVRVSASTATPHCSVSTSRTLDTARMGIGAACATQWNMDSSSPKSTVEDLFQARGQGVVSTKEVGE